MNMLRTTAGAPYDEMHAEGHRVREHYREFQSWLAAQSADSLAGKRAEADLSFHRVGITFAVYGDDQGTERLIPLDIIPRAAGLKLGAASAASHARAGGSAGARVKSKQSDMSSAFASRVFKGGKPKSVSQNFSRLTCECSALERYPLFA